jgi:hypothetical protein
MESTGMTDIHSCSHLCQRPACVAQRLEIKRFDPELYDQDRVRMEQWEDGEYVKYTDHLVQLDKYIRAAAPELLEALQKLLVLYQGKRQGIWGEQTEPVKNARAAIAKATGETK